MKTWYILRNDDISDEFVSRTYSQSIAEEFIEKNKQYNYVVVYHKGRELTCNTVEGIKGVVNDKN